jgi:DNA-directed RNA polymerase subunit E'/Rpb7
METVLKQPQQKFKKRETKITSIYSRCLITRNIILPITNIGKNIKETIEENIKANFENKCLVEGFIKPNSTKIITYSSGIIYRGSSISFEVVFECEVCFPVEGMLISCVAKNITKAGIRCESANDVPSPVIVFIAKDHHYNISYFNEVKEGDKITVRVIGQRFELNDKYVSVIGELVKPTVEKEFTGQKQGFDKSREKDFKPRLIIEDEA